MAWFEPIGIAQTVARTGLRSEASARFERGVDPYVIDPAIARFVELLAETCPDVVVRRHAVDARSDRPARRPSGRPGCGWPQVDADPRAGDPGRRDRRAARADRVLRHPRRRRRAGGRHPVVAARQQRARSTSSKRSAGSTATTAIGKRMPSSTIHGRLSSVQKRRRELREVLLGLGHLRGACRTRSSRPTPSPGPASTATSLRIANPLVADESVLRTSLRPGPAEGRRLQRVAPPPGVSLFEIGHVYPPGPGELPDEYEALGVVLAGAEAPAAVAVWREVAAAMGIGARLDQGRVPPGLHADAVGHARRRPRHHRRGRRGRARGARRRSTSTSASPCSSSTSATSLDREPKPAQWKPTSRHPSSDLDLAFVLARRRAGRTAGQGDPPGRRRAARRPRAVRRLPRRAAGAGSAQPGLPAAAAGRPTATSPTPTSPPCGEKVVRRRGQARRRPPRLTRVFRAARGFVRPDPRTRHSGPRAGEGRRLPCEPVFGNTARAVGAASPPKRRVLGIDPGLTRCGYAVVDGVRARLTPSPSRSA